MKNRLIENWEKNALIISIGTLVLAGILELFVKCLTSSYPTIISIITGLAAGIIATIIVLFLQRNHERNDLLAHYSKYAGLYKRIDIGQDNTPEQNLDGMRQENVGLDITMTYLGGHEFSIEINYWKSENAKAKAFVEFNPKDKQSAKGTYRYIQGQSYTGEFSHYGKLELSWDENKKEMIVIYHHLHPRKIPFNPDNNRGWEIWAKVNVNNFS